MRTAQNDISKAIRMGLAKKGLRQKDLASFLGITEAAVSSWMIGKATPSYKYLLKTLEYLDIREEFLAQPEKEKKLSIEKDILALMNLANQITAKINK